MEWLLWLIVGFLSGLIVAIIFQWISRNKKCVFGWFKINTSPDKELFEVHFDDDINDVYEKEYVLLKITNDLEDAPEKQSL